MTWEEYDGKQCYECIFFTETDLSGRGECGWFCKDRNGFDFACSDYEANQIIYENT